MSSCNRRLFALTAFAALAACGFTPVYGPQGGGTTLQGAVLVEAPLTRDDYLLTRELETRLGRANPARWALDYDITVRQEAIAISSTNVTTRYDLLGVVSYALRDVDSDKVVAKGRVNSFTGYSASGTTVATLAAEEDARERLMVILADQIVTRLIATAPDPTQ